MKTKWIVIAASIGAFALLLSLNILYFNNTIVMAVAFLSLVFPYFIYRSIIASRMKKLNREFTSFLLDLGSIMETRISLMGAMPSVYKRDYGILNDYISKLHIKTSWGIPFFDAFIRMGKETKSRLIDKSISVIIGTFISGGDLKKIFQAMGLHTREIMKLKEKISGRVKTITVSCYMIFGCLLFSVYIISKTFLPSLTGITKGSSLAQHEFKEMIFHLMLIQSLFAGLVTGQMAEDSVFSGIKHSIVLVTITIIFYGVFL